MENELAEHPASEEQQYPPSFTSRTIQRMDTIATEHGWTRTQDRIGGFVTYRRNTLYVDVYISLTGAVVSASTNRRGGRYAVGTGKAEQVIAWLSSVTR